MKTRIRRSIGSTTMGALVVVLMLPVVSRADVSTSAREDLIRHHPRAISRLSPDQRAVLEVLSPDEAQRWSTGSPTDEVLTLDGRTLADWLADTKLAGTSFEMSWWSVDGGGGVSNGDGFTLAGTIGQHDSAISAGGPYAFRGGFWTPLAADPPFFADGFEDGTTDAWSSTSP